MGRQLTHTEYSLFIFSLTFLITFTIVLGLIPPAMYAGDVQPATGVPQDFSTVDYVTFSDPHDEFLRCDSGAVDFSVGGWNVHVTCYDQMVRMETYESWWVFTWGYKSLEWTTKQKVKVSSGDGEFFDVDNVDVYWDAKKKYAEFYTVKDDAHFTVFVTYDRGEYTSAEEAYENQKLHFLFCCGLDSQKSAYNIFTIIGMLFTFQFPGVPFPFSIILVFPFWASVVILIFIMFLKLLPF